jgi:hypothetical protein
MMFMTERQWASTGVRTKKEPLASSKPAPNHQTNDDVLVSKTVQIERKTFFLTLRENARGRFLRITEDVNGRRDSIILPSTGLVDFRNAINSIVDLSENQSRQHAEPDLPPLNS